MGYCSIASKINKNNGAFRGVGLKYGGRALVSYSSSTFSTKSMDSSIKIPTDNELLKVISAR